VQELVEAAKIGMSYGRVLYTDTIARALAEMRDTAAMDDFFQQALRVNDRTYLTHLHYAQGLSVLGDSRAEEWYKKAIGVQPEDNVDALAYYAEWLLDHHREEDVLQIVKPDEHIEYLHFVRGVALERMGLVDQAREEYDKFALFSRDFPAPARFRIEGSEAQRGVVFEGERGRSPGPSSIILLITPSQARQGLSYLLNKESPDETQGGMRMVGWTVRTRVFHGGAPGEDCMVGVFEGTRAEKYKKYMCQTGAFVWNECDWCKNPDNPNAQCTATWKTNHVAKDIWYGKAPEPRTRYCPCGEPDSSESACRPKVHCTCNSQTGAPI